MLTLEILWSKEFNCLLQSLYDNSIEWRSKCKIFQCQKEIALE